MKSFLISIFCFLVISTSQISGQNLFQEKFEGCQISNFCLDCGDIKAVIPSTFIQDLIKGLDKESLRLTFGDIEIQILVDSVGKPCLISANNQTKIKSSKLKLQDAVNNSSNWIPALQNKKPISSSVSLLIRFGMSDVKLARRSFDSDNETNMRSEGIPDVKGTSAKLLTESWTVFNQENSELPWDMSRAVVKDIDNTIWIGTDNGIVKIVNGDWHHFNVQNSPIKSTMYDKSKTEGIEDIAVDHNNNKWFISAWSVYKFDNVNWTIFDSTNSPIKWARTVFVDKQNNVWFTSWDGLAKFDGKRWSVVDSTNSQIPTNQVLGAFIDSRNRLWIGTFKGNVMIDGNHTFRFTDSESPLSKANISKGYEDKEGNIWFSLENDKSVDAGIYVLKTDGMWKRINLPDYVMFKGGINDFLLDEDKNVLWIAINGIGLLKFDINKESLEIYTNHNSKVPSTVVSKLALDKDGQIWATTFAGVIKQNKK